jgi:hypothetical protein
MTKITIEVDGSPVVSTQSPASSGEQSDSKPASLSDANDGGSASSADASHIGPVANLSSAAASSPSATTSTDGAISAGPAPASLMGGIQ